MNCEEADNGFGDCVEGYLDFSKADRWVVSTFNKKIKNIENNFKDYRFDLTKVTQTF